MPIRTNLSKLVQARKPGARWEGRRTRCRIRFMAPRIVVERPSRAAPPFPGRATWHSSLEPKWRVPSRTQTLRRTTQIAVSATRLPQFYLSRVRARSKSSSSPRGRLACKSTNRNKDRILEDTWYQANKRVTRTRRYTKGHYHLWAPRGWHLQLAIPCIDNSYTSKDRNSRVIWAQLKMTPRPIWKVKPRISGWALSRWMKLISLIKHSAETSHRAITWSTSTICKWWTTSQKWGTSPEKIQILYLDKRR